jgi:type II secretory ATPase GspE/PulE/Tfp pilus assembly ATPase PilB-like protein
LPISKEISRLMMQEEYSLDRIQKEQKGSLYQSGLEKVKAGLTSLEELRRIGLIFYEI